MRLESIKHQILSKLGLKHKPNVTHPLPKEFIWDTIYRADGIKSFNDFSNNYAEHHHYRYVSQQSFPLWSSTLPKGSNIMMTQYKQPQEQQHRQYTKGPVGSSFEGNGVESTQTYLGHTDIDGKKNGRKQEQMLQNTRSTHINDDINKNNNKGDLGITETTISTKSFNQILYITTNQNKFNHTSTKAMKQNHKSHKNPQHITTTPHSQQQLQQINRRKQINTKNNINNNEKNNINNNFNNKNNKYISYNNKNIIITTQNHIDNNNNNQHSNNNNNKYIAAAKKFTYLTDIKSSHGSFNSVVYHNNLDDTDENFSIAEKQQQLLQEESVLDDNTNNPNDVDNMNADDIALNRHENYLPKLEVFDENDDFFGVTQEIITFAEKGKYTI